MAKKSSSDEVYRGERWRVMWITEDGKIEEKKYDDEFEAKQHYFSISKPNKLRQLNLIKECKYYTMYWEWL